MRSIDKTTNNLLVNQVRNLRHSETQVQHIIENNRVREGISELKIRVVYSS